MSNPFSRLKKAITFSTMVGTLFLSPVSSGEDWPQFRGPTAQGISAAKNIPTEWSPTKNVAWKISVPGNGWASPIVADGRIYISTAIGEETGNISLHLICYNASDGALVWDTQLFKPVVADAKKHHKKNSIASATPIYAEGKIYAHFGHMGTAAVDTAGKILWKQETIKYAPVHGTGSTPALIGNKLIFSCDGNANPFIVALDTKDGSILWRTMRNTTAKRTFSFCTPLAIDVAGKTQMILPGSGFVAAYNPDSGQEIWKVKYGEGYSVVPRPVFGHGLLFLSSGFDAAVLYAIKPEGAAGDATAGHIAWTQRKGAPHTPSTLLVGNELYFVADNGLASCVDAVTGNTHWTHSLGGGFSASPILVGENIYLQNEAGKGFVIKAGKTFQLISENDLEERSLASYAVTGDALLIRTEKHLWKIEAK